MYAMKEEIYIFDLDGTLIDSMPCATELVLRFLDEHGVAYTPDIIQTLTPLGFQGIASYYSEVFKIPLTPQEIYAQFVERLTKAYAEDIPLREGVKATLEGLKERGARLNLLTASPHVFTDVCLKNRGVYDLFENVWTASEDFGLLKSDVRIYEEAAKRLGVAPFDCVMADDSLCVLQTAKASGMRTVGVYDRFSDGNWAEIERIADERVFRLPELLGKE